MPNGEQKDISDSIRVCDYLGIDRLTVNIESAFSALFTSIERTVLEDSINVGVPNCTLKGTHITVSEKSLTNVAPRIRMTTLYAIAQTLGYRVAGTGNKSEIFIGWFTKWGDGGCDIDPIAHLTCTEVIELGDYLGLPYDLVHKTPADGLTGKSDEENLGFTYAEIDHFINKYEAIISTGHIEEPFTMRDIEIANMHDRAYHKTSVIKLM